MDRRNFLSGIITAAGAGAVTLATDQEVSAFSTGTPAILAPDFGSVPFPYPGSVLFVRDQGSYAPIGVLTSVTYGNDGHGREIQGQFTTRGVAPVRLGRL